MSVLALKRTHYRSVPYYFGLVCAVFSFLPSLAPAQTLVQLWERIATSEPNLLAALSQAQAISERKNQTYAQFLPQVNFTANTTHNHRQYQTTGVLPSISNDWYNSNGVQINLTQSIWKRSNNISHRQANSATIQAEQQYLVAQQELLGKLVSTWVEALYARHALQTANTVETAANQQLINFEKGLALGLYAVSQRDEVKAKRQQAISERYAAESELLVRHTALEQLVGRLPAIDNTFVNLDLNKIPFGTLASFAQLTETLEDNNPSIKASEMALKVASEEVHKQQSLHEPTLDLVAGLGRNSQLAAGTTPAQSGFKNRLDTVALQLNIPLYAGGAQSSKVREAAALETKIRYELDASKRNAFNQANLGWAQVRASQAKLEAAEQAYAFARASEKLAIIGQINGTKTPLDELQAKQLVETALRDAHRAYYDNILGMTKLMLATGLVEESTLADIQARLQSPKAFSPAPSIGILLK